MIILREKNMHTRQVREQLEEELGKKLGEKVVILPANLEVEKGLNQAVKSAVVDLVECNLRLIKVIRGCMKNELSGEREKELETQALILNDLKKYVEQKEW